MCNRFSPVVADKSQCFDAVSERKGIQHVAILVQQYSKILLCRTQPNLTYTYSHAVENTNLEQLLKSLRIQQNQLQQKQPVISCLCSEWLACTNDKSITWSYLFSKPLTLMAQKAERRLALQEMTAQYIVWLFTVISVVFCWTNFQRSANIIIHLLDPVNRCRVFLNNTV